MTKPTNTSDFNDQAVYFSTFAVPTAGETAAIVGEQVAQKTGKAVRMLAIATILGLTAAVNISCGDDESTPAEPTLPDHPRANTIGIIKNLGNSTHPGIQVMGYEGVTPGSIVPTELVIDFTTDNPQNKDMIKAWIKAFRDFFPNEGFNENTTIADIDAFLIKDDKNVILNRMYILDKNGSNRVDLVKEDNLHSLSEITKQTRDLQKLILDNPAAKGYVKETKYRKNGEEIVNKELVDGVQVILNSGFNSPYVGGDWFFSGNFNRVPIIFVAYTGK